MNDLECVECIEITTCRSATGGTLTGKDEPVRDRPAPEQMEEALAKLEAQLPKTAIGQIIRLLPRIERLLAEGRSHDEVLEVLHAGGVKLSRSSFPNTLMRARRKRALLLEAQRQITEPFDSMRSKEITRFDVPQKREPDRIVRPVSEPKKVIHNNKPDWKDLV